MRTPTKFAPFLPLLPLLVAFVLRAVGLADIPFGWHPDEATKALLARDVMAGQGYPVFFSAFTGREALYVYLEVAFFSLLGESIFAARLISVFTGLLTVAMSYTVGRLLFNRRVGLLTAFFLAVSLWHLVASRNGYRGVLQPMVQLPVIWLLLAGWRQRQTGGWRYYLPFALSGFFLGLTQYTYTAVRFFLPLFAGLVGLRLLLSPDWIKQQLRPLLLLAFVAALTFLPLGLYFLENPYAFYGRAAQVSVFAPEFAGDSPTTRLWQSVKETARMFTVWGDPNFRFNLAGQPVFGFVDGLLFYIGLPLCLWQAIRARSAGRRFAYLTPFFWVGAMLLPMTLSAESLPYYQRAIGVLPAIFFFPALAADWLLTQAAQLTRRREIARLVYALPLILLFLFLTVRVSGHYFLDWHTAEQNDDDRRVAMVYVADFLKRQATDELYLSTEYLQHPTLALLAPERYDQIRWFDARQSFPLPPVGQTAAYVLLLENRPQPNFLALLPQLEMSDVGYDRFGRPVYETYYWRDQPRPTPDDQMPAVWSWEVVFEPDDPGGLRQPIELPVNFGDILQFTGHNRAGSELTPGSLFEMISFWELARRSERPYTFFVHLLDQNSRVVAGHDANYYPSPFWREEGGELLLSYAALYIPPDVPAGDYQLQIGVYHQPTGERLPILDGREMVADRLLLRPVRVIAP